ncbi:hypothetical protein SAMN05192561_1252 [Halopenitus malekzadehii]|uniref:Uncharacterized protein n=1 Tax=Halopenitus malekzadehii TaxID=1267564 RepID=A0A1H6K419_9EURY|nr:hypothetical protein [Halopenitus malekzadehii]SEH66522.1 hypothetical protein SAMN05192561_1252 [Halopenitus malekzadehii]
MVDPTNHFREVLEMIAIDQAIVRIDVDGYKPIVEISRMAHKSDLSPIEFTQNAFDILSHFLEPHKGLLPMVSIAYILGELYRCDFKIQPTKYASAAGYGSGSLSATPS